MKLIEINLQDIKGFCFANEQNQAAGTGCTVILSKQGVLAGVDVRGGAPGTRETDLLKSENLVEEIHGLFLAGGSAYGLSVGSGVMEVLEKENSGFDVTVAKVPIVPGAILFDLNIGSSDIRPDSEMGVRAAEIALESPPFISGNYGAGTGASVGKCQGNDRAMKGGIGQFAIQVGNLQIGAVVAVNSFGDIIDPSSGERIAGVFDRNKQKFMKTERILLEDMESQRTNRFSGNTSLGVVVTNASMTKSQANKLASIAHDGFARTMMPSHTFVDGDTIFTMSTNDVEVDLNSLSYLTTYVVERAVVEAIHAAQSNYGLLSYRDIKKLYKQDQSK
ncbi:P1 family peptidase [Halobacillus seohaensis]|uniref:P1 family peptidase n=1 Tax=Halobacillus seohaensis TaxID=447421 RepID=A0ABW2EDI1_9BACI